MMYGREKSNFAHSSCEAGEQGGAIRRGAGGAKGGDQGECGLAKHAPNQSWARVRMRESCTYGSERGARGNSRPYRDVIFAAVRESEEPSVNAAMSA